MKNKLPYIFLVLAVIICASIVIKGINDKKASHEENANYAQSIKNDTESAKTEQIYEYYQTNPENGLAVIYTFRINGGENEKRSGSITVDGAGKTVNITCAVKHEGNTMTFLFADYAEGSDITEKFSMGDELLRLHKKEKETVPEFIKLSKVYPEASIIRNY